MSGETNDGSYRYSKVISVVPDIPYTDGVHVSPNPARDYVQINIQSSRNTLAEIAILDQQGKLIKLLKEQVNEGNTLITLPDPGAWPRGMYYVVLKMGDKLFHKKLVIIN